MAWGVEDFAAAGGVVVGVGAAYRLAARRTGSGAGRAAVGVALAAAFVLVWATLAVGVVGAEDNPANLMVVSVLAVGIVGTVVARFRPRGMARAMLATALAQTLVAVVAGLAASGYVGLIAGCFAVPWLLSAWLFRKAAREQAAGAL